MTDYISNLQKAIKAMHGCRSRHVETFSVKTGIGPQIAFDGEVELFDLKGHPEAKQCYAWGYMDGPELKCTAVLVISPVTDALTAVMIALTGKR